ncbi:hypothetical protein D3C73_1478600 [compost metagenome]
MGFIQGRTRIIGHASVNSHILADIRNVLVGAHRIQGRSGVPNDAAARLDPNFRDRIVLTCEGGVDAVHNGIHIFGNWKRSIPVHVTDAEAAAQIDYLKQHIQL